MNKITKIILTMVTIVLASNLVTVNVEAKEYKAKKSDKSYRIWVSDDFKKGKATFYNRGEFYLEAGYGYTVFYSVKENTTNVKSVKAPTIKSKKTTGVGEGKTLTIKRNTVVKFKVVKGKVTKSKVKKAKTYYVICQVKPVDFAKQKSGNYTVDYNKEVDFGINFKACDKIEGKVNGKKFKEEFSDGQKKVRRIFKITAPTTIQVTGYKLGKKLGTYTYKYDVQKYTHSKIYKTELQGEFPKPECCHESFYLPYGEGYALSYTLDGSTPTLNHGTFVENPENDDVFKRGYTVENTKDCELTLKVQYFEKTYVKNGKKYQFAGYQPYGKVLGGRFTMISTNGIHSILNDGDLCATESYKDPYNFYDFQCTDNLDYCMATYLDNKGYVRTIKLMPGERISEYSDWGALEIVEVIPVKNGKMESRYLAKEMIEMGCEGFREDFLTWEVFLASYEVYEKGLPETEFPRLTPRQTYADSSQSKAGVGLIKGDVNNAEWID